MIAISGQWGGSQLLMAALFWILFVRHRGLVRLILAACLVEPFMRGLAGHVKPIETLGTAPGAALDWVVVPVLAVVLCLALCRADAQGSSPPRS